MDKECTAYELYICDPSKNTECSKAGCLMGWCKSTSYPQYAKLNDNGEPIFDIEFTEYAKKNGITIIKREQG